MSRRRDAGNRFAVPAPVDGKIVCIRGDEPRARVLFGEDDQRGIAPIAPPRVVADDFGGPAGVGGIDLKKTDQSGVQRSQQLKERRRMGFQMMRRLREHRFGRERACTDGA